MTFQERYKYNPATDLLGKGGFARVYKARDILLDRDVAIKIFNATDSGQYTVIDEIKKAIRLQHPNLLRYYDVAVVSNINALGEAETLQIGVMELANAGDLKQYARKNPDLKELVVLLKQLLSGLGYLHQKGIIHRDLKPQNILLVEEEDGTLTARISDFGISKSLNSDATSASMAIGTIEYMAPEQFSPGKYGVNGKIGTNVDLWSFGILVHELLTNQPLFGQRSGHITAEQIMNAILSQEIPDNVNSLAEPFRTIVKKCLVADAKLRVQYASELIPLLEMSEKEISASVSEPDSGFETAVYHRPIYPNNDFDAGETKLIPTPNKPFAKPEAAPVLPSPSIPANEGKKVKKQSAPVPVQLSEPVPGDESAPVYNPYPEEPVKKSRLLPIMLVGLVLVSVGGFIFWKKAGNSVASRSVDYAQIDKWMNEKKYDAVLLALKDSVMAVGATELKETYNKAVPYYALSYLGKGDTTSALNFLEKGAEAGNRDCMFELGSLYYLGGQKPQNFGTALTWFTKAADLDDPRSEVMLGNMYLMGQGVNINDNEAIRYYFKAADQGNTVAMYALGLAYLNGSGVEQNKPEARKWLEKVLKINDNPDAINAAKQLLSTF